MRKFYSLVLIAAGLLIGTQGWAETYTCKIGTVEYESVAAAIAAVPANDVPTTITMINEEDLNPFASSPYCKINKAQNVLLDLDGHTLYAKVTDNGTHELFMNYGTFTIMDSQDTDKDGDDGKILMDIEVSSGGQAYYNIVKNFGTLIVLSGMLEQTRNHYLQGSYVIDQHNEGQDSYCTVEGGKLKGDYCVFRQYRGDQTHQNVITILGGELISTGHWRFNYNTNQEYEWPANGSACNIFYVQEAGENKNYTLNIAGGNYDNHGNAMIYLETANVDGALEHTNINISGGVTNGLLINIDHTFNSTNPDELAKVQATYDQVFSITGGTCSDNIYTISGGINVRFDPETGCFVYDDASKLIPIQESTLPTIIDGTYYKPNPTGRTETEVIISHIDNKNATHASDIKDENEAYTVTESVELTEGTNAEAYNITIKNNVVLTVKDGAVLTIGDGGMTIEDGAKVIVEAGGILKVGANGIIGNGANALEVYSDKTGSGVVAISPQAFLHQSPELKVIMKTRGYTTETGSKYQFFAIPTKEGADVNWPGSLNTWFFEYDNTKTGDEAWVLAEETGDMVPFKGYIMTNNSKEPWQEYTMAGAVNGRENANMVLKGDASKAENWNLLGNSYLAPIDAATMLNEIKVKGDENAAGIELSISIYDAAVGEANSYLTASYATLTEEGNKPFTVIPPMNAFFMNLKSMNEAGFTIDYANCVWNQDPISTQAMYAPKRSATATCNIKLSVTAEGLADRVILRESDDFTSAFDNGYEASKMMNDEMNLYVNSDAPMAELATDNLDGTQLSFQAGNAVEYTMTFNNRNNDNFVLVDNLTNAQVAMTDGATYTFVATPNETVENRFEIRKAGGVVTNLAEMKAAHAVKGIYTAAGQYVGKADRWNTLPAGMYIVDGVKMAK